MQVSAETTPPLALLRVAGRIDTLTSAALEAAVQSALAGGATRLLFDLSGVDYVSSAGLRVFLMAAKKTGKGATGLFGLRPAVLEVFTISGIDHFIPISPGEAAARTAIGEG